MCDRGDNNLMSLWRSGVTQLFLILLMNFVTNTASLLLFSGTKPFSISLLLLDELLLLHELLIRATGDKVPSVNIHLENYLLFSL